MLCYILVNAVFLRSTPIAEMAGKEEVGLIAGGYLFGAAGAKVMAVLICVGLVSAISAMMWIGPRVTMAMGEDFSALRWLGRKTQFGIPARATLVQGGIGGGPRADVDLPGRAYLRAVRAASLFLSHGARGHCPPENAAGLASSLQDLGISGYATSLPRYQRLDAGPHLEIQSKRINVGPGHPRLGAADLLSLSVPA